jgi:hypothetical protein
MRVLCVTGVPCGGKSHATMMLLDQLESVGVRATRVGTGRIAQRLADGALYPSHAREMLRLGLLCPDQKGMMDQLQAELYAEELCGFQVVVVDGAPRVGMQVDALRQMPRVEPRVLVVQPDHLRLSVNLTQRDEEARWMQPQREALWYGKLFHEVIEACVYHAVPFYVVGELSRGIEPMVSIVEWLKGGTT